MTSSSATARAASDTVFIVVEKHDSVGIVLRKCYQLHKSEPLQEMK